MTDRVPRHDPMECHASDVDGCAARFKAQLIDGLDTSGEPAKVGTAVHACAERIVIERATAPMIDVMQVALAELRNQTHVLQLPPGSVLDALDILERVLAPDSKIQLWPEAGWSGAAEVRWGLIDNGHDFEYVEDPDEPCDAGGTIDLLQWTADEIRVDDLKSVRRMPSAEDAYESWQLRLYAFAALRKFPEKRSVDAGFTLLRHGYRASATLMRGDPWEDQVARRIRTIRQERRRILDLGDFPETPGPWCAWCPVMFRCEAIREAAEMGADAHAALTPSEAARLWCGAKALTSRLGRHVTGLAEASDYELIPLEDAHGTVLGLKDVAGWEVMQSYDATLRRLRELGMTREQEIERFRFCARHHFASRVRDVLRELRIGGDVAEELVAPIAKTRFTTFVPDGPAAAQREWTLEEIESEIDRRMAVG